MSEPVSPNPGSGGKWCEECGYNLRGLPPGQPCPECGHLTREDEFQPSPYAAWARHVFFGLTLLLLVTLDAASAVLIQPAADSLGGAGPALNVPGPKLWAMPLLQRPIGRRPELPGVVGTRTAVLSLLAVWLITAPGAAAGLQPDQLPRRLTRWLSVVLFGGALGVLLAAEGLSPRDLAPYRLLLAAGVELPAAVLLYTYLYRLAGHVPGRGRRAVLGRLAWLVPVTIAAGAAAIAVHWVRVSAAAGGRAGPDIPPAFVLLGTGVYGILAVGCGVAATAAVASLAAAYFHAAFPLARRWVRGGRYLWRRARAWRSRVTPDRTRDLRVAGGLVLLIATVYVGSDHALWAAARQAPGGNLPFLNYPGPKVWVAAATVGLSDYSSYSTWAHVESRSLFIFMNVGAVWLVTTSRGSGGKRALRFVARATTVLAVGAAAGCTMASGVEYGRYDSIDRRLAVHVFAIITLVLEWPATAVLYLYLARLAHDHARPSLARQFHLINGAVLVLVAGGTFLFALSRSFPAGRWTTVLALASFYGAGAFAAAAWAIAAVLTLAAIVVRDGMAQKEAAPPGGGTA